ADYSKVLAPLTKLELPPAPIFSREREPPPHLHIYTTRTSALLTGSPDGAVKSDIHSDTVPHHLEPSHQSRHQWEYPMRIGLLWSKSLENPMKFVFHLVHSVIKLKYDPEEGERCSLTKAKTTCVGGGMRVGVSPGWDDPF
ncbi:hypothetical protein AVEN_201633-1, partial [Araneus ventricosus]